MFRLEGKISCSAENLVGVLTDDKYRKEWDEYVHTMESIDPDVDGNECIYWRVKFPMPMTDREYVYYRKKVETKPGRYVVLARAAKLGDHKEATKKPIRVETYEQYTFIEAIDDAHCAFRGYMCDDPKGDIPKKVINWAVKTAMPKFCDTMCNNAAVRALFLASHTNH